MAIDPRSSWTSGLPIVPVQKASSSTCRTCNEAVVQVERICHFVSGIHYEGQNGNLGARSAAKSIRRQYTATTLSFEFMINSQAVHVNRQRGRIAWQLLAWTGWKLRKNKLVDVLASDTLPIRRGGFTSAGGLGDFFAQGLVQLNRINVECGSIRRTIDYCELERCATHSVRKSFLRRSKARFKAGDGFEGESNALAKHS